MGSQAEIELDNGAQSLGLASSGQSTADTKPELKYYYQQAVQGKCGVVVA